MAWGVQHYSLLNTQNYCEKKHSFCFSERSYRNRLNVVDGVKHKNAMDKVHEVEEKRESKSEHEFIHSLLVSIILIKDANITCLSGK